MRYPAIRNHLKPYSIVGRRRTTINHAFAAAIAPHDSFDDAQVRCAMGDLGLDPDQPLLCAYCGASADTFDHVFATVKDSLFSGHGHRLGNLLPCCKPCNSRKGNRAWQIHLASLDLPASELAERRSVIAAYLEKYTVLDPLPATTDDYTSLQAIRAEILELLAKADTLAAKIRAQRK